MSFRHFGKKIDRMNPFEPFLYGKYIILNRLAIGGMAEVFFAKSYGVRGFQRLLVIKRILPNLSKDEEFVEMFIDEAKISVELNHSNICQVTDLGKIDGNYFIAMEYVNGKDLRAILKKSHVLQKPIPPEYSIYIMSEVLKGLDYAHKREDTITGRSFSVVHRDISPQNVMVSYQGDVKIVDFGIAKTEFKLHRTQAGVLKGKFAYMSPEQAMGLELDARTDIFSASILLYEMLSGDRLFLGGTDFETLENIKMCKVPPLSKTLGNIPEELDNIVLRGLKKNADDRWESAGDMQVALTKLLYSNYPDFHPDQISGFLQTLFRDEIASENNALKGALEKISDEQIQKAEKASAMDQENHGHNTILSPSSARMSGITRPSLLAKLNIDQWSPLGKGAALFALAFVLYFALKALLVSTPAPTPTATNTTSQPSQLTYEITSTPDQAWISLNGERKGLTPLSIVLPTNTFYDVEITKDGFLPLKQELQTTPNQTQIAYTLTKETPTLGNLRIQTQPEGAKIFIDNEDTGKNTPATIENLSMQQTFKVVLQKEGYRSVSQNVLIKEVQNSLDLTLEKITATLKVHTVPANATILIDGQQRGSTIDGLKPNQTYTVTVSKKGYETVTKSIPIQSNYVEIDIELRKEVIKKGALSVSATPWAQVIVNGKVIGPSPVISHPLPVGSHKLILRHPDFDDIEKDITIREGQNNKVIIDLRNP